MYIESSAPRRSGDKARLRSEVFPATTASCLAFWYNMYGVNIGSLNIYQEIVSLSTSPTTGFTKLKSIVGNQGQRWQLAQIPVSARAPYSLIIEGTVGNGYQGDLALDDISLTTGACPATTTSPPMFNCGGSTGTTIPSNKVCDFKKDCSNGADEANCGTCNFDGSSGLCGFTDVSQGSFRWQRDNKGTPTNNTGPSVDHTRGTALGYYMYVDANNGRYNSMAQLQTPTLQQASSTCQYTFWYHMSGRSIGKLSVATKVGSVVTQLWSLRGNQGNTWKQAVIDIGRVAGPFQLIMQASRSFSVVGDIAIDDTNFTNCGLPQPQASCSSTQRQCSNGVCVDKTRWCDFTDDCGDSSDEKACTGYSQCTFESSFCSWQQDHGDQFDWTRTSGPTRTSSTGPSRDHTTGLITGHYVYIETSYPRKSGDRARLLSPVWSSTTAASNCYFAFYYNMNGLTMGALNVYIRQQSGSLTTVWSRSGTRGNIWSRASIPLVYSQPFQVIIEGVRGRSVLGDIGVDDTVFSPGCTMSAVVFPGQFTVPPSIGTTVSPTCGAGNFQCKSDSKCIPVSKLCDFTRDCTDGTDEVNCGPCTFENDLCKWTDISAGRYNWTRSLAGNANGPATDHTLRSGQGHYGFVEGTNGVFFSRAILSSPTLSKTSVSCEMDFYYNMNGARVGSLLVSANVNGSMTTLWSRTGSQGPGWRKGVVYIGQKLGALGGGLKMRFEAQPVRGFAATSTADIAIDDISFSNCNPSLQPPNVACNFDTDLCVWTNAADDKFDWSRKNGSTSSPGTGPRTDHTSRHGSYIYIETSSPRRRGDIARLDSPVLTPTPAAGHCLSFWYYMFGPNIGSLKIYLQNNYNRSLFWSKVGPQGDKWTQASRTVQSNIDYVLTIEGIVGNGFQGDIAIDDIQVASGPCPPDPACDFQSGFCSWTQSKTDDFDWIRKKNGTVSAGTGPPFDHTFGSDTGYYIYIETSAPRRPNDRAVLVGPTLDGSSTRCFSFWYHMYGQSIGRLIIHQVENGSSLPRTLWLKSGDQGNMWRHGYVTVTPHSKPYTIQIEAMRGNSFTGDIAVDDVQLNDGRCPRPGFCSFERDTCEWTNALQGDDFDWLRDYGGTPSTTTGPKVDHTLGNSQGYYMYIETSGAGRKSGEKAWLVSDNRDPASSACLVFWYNMYGSGIGSLNVYTKPSKGAMNQKWSLSGNQGNVWQRAQVNVPSPVQYTVIFEGVRGGNYSGDIAIDDVSITRGRACYGISNSSATTSSPTGSATAATFPPSSFDCTFEQGLASWTQDKSDQFDWSIATGTTLSRGTGPSSDHTLQSSSGHYAYIEVSGQSANSTARLVSPSLFLGSTGQCFKFWFNMYGANVNKLNIYSKQGSVQKLLWTRSGNHGLGWHYGQVQVMTPGTTQIVIEGVAGVRYDGDIAIDDLSSNMGSCPPEQTCDFETGMCGYIQDKSDQFDWSMHTGSTGTSGTGPQADHTYGTSTGHYLYIESSSPNHPGDKARLDSPQFPQTLGSCVTFWYSMNGNQIGTLSLYKNVNGQRGNPIWSLTGNQGLKWRKAQTTVISSTNYRITFEGTVGNGYHSDIAIDDIDITDGACPSLGSCDFEKDLCTWTNANAGDSFDWERAQGRTVSTGTGPSNDHTLNTPYGTYLFIEASTPRKTGDKAWLISTTFQNNTNYCLSMWYNMNGQGMGTLNVNVWPYNTGSKQTNAWSINGNQGRQWKQMQTDVFGNGANYRVVIEAVRGPTFNSDIAIDDIVMRPGTCSGSPLTTPSSCVYQCNGKCIPSNKICDFTIDCPADQRDEKSCGYSCTFEDNTCKWNNVNNGTFIWQKNSGATPTSNTGPSIDHTTLGSTGHYMYVDASNGFVFNTAQYQSPLLQQSSSSCQMVFYYHMNGAGIGELRVYSQIGTRKTQLYYLNGNQGNSWKKAVIPIGRIRSQFKMLISARRYYSSLGDIAIDDISFSNCQLPTPRPSCQPNQFQCGNGACIMKTRVCDFTDDCGDLSDEGNVTCAAYTGCTFESGTCIWSQSTNDDFDWTRSAGQTSTVGTGPSRDHTLNSAVGHYMYIETSRPRRQGQKARLISPFMVANSTSPYCTIRFYYEMYGQDVASLVVSYRTQVAGALTRLWGRQGPVGDYFERQEISVYNKSPVQIVIEATVGKSYHGDIAIDDISLTPSCIIWQGPVVTSGVIHPTPPNPCGAGKFQCANSRQCIPQEKVCDFINYCSDGSDESNCGICQFETGLCGWQDMSTGLYAWERHNGTTPSPVSGPSSDHTFGSGKVGNYMFVDAAKGTFTGRADLVSPLYGALGSQCTIQFAFHKKGGTGGYMRLYLLPPNTPPTSQLGRIYLWSASQGDNWQMATVGIGRRPPGYRLVFEAIKSSNAGDMAIDDVDFFNCVMAAPIGNCSSNQFTCGNKACVDNNLVCDWSDDCGDQTDEATCSKYVGRCNFETDFCNWIQDDSDNFNWSWQSGSTATIGTGPRLDHTLGTLTGHYIYIETSSPRRNGDKARLKSPVFQATMTASCRVRFFYHMFGKDVNSLNVYKESFELGPMVLIWNMTGQQTDAWKRADIPITNNAPFRVIIEGVAGSGYKGDIGVDDISFTPGCQIMSEATLPAVLTTPSVCGPGKLPCKNGQCIASTLFCNFRQNDCADGSDEAQCPTLTDFETGNLQYWTNDFVQNNFNWTIGSNGNPAALTGPTTDHTKSTTSGQFAFVTGLVVNQLRDVARLISPIYNQAGKTCNFTFWYNIHGKEFTTLTVYIRRGSTESKLWSIGSDTMNVHADMWQYAVVSLPICASSFQIIVEASSFGAYGASQGFLAIDDLKFMNCEYPPPPTKQCMMGQFTCDTGHCVPETFKCDFQPDCCDSSDEKKSVCSAYNMCDFEFGMCGWQQLANDQFDWKRHRGPTSSYGTGPSQDHSSGSTSGYYLFIESSQPRLPNDTARISLNLPQPNGVCAIRFWYHMYGRNIGSLNVYMNTLNQGMVRKWSSNGAQGNTWMRNSVTLDSNTPFQVIIEGVIGTGYRGDIAIDDISLTPGCGVPTGTQVSNPTPSLLPRTTPKPCPPGQYTCNNGQCIAVIKACDAINDCSDGSDESRCPKSCNFESDSCGWMETVVDGFDWVRASGAQVSAAGQTSAAPSIDYTRKTQNGHFVYVKDTTAGHTQGKLAQFVSPTLYSASQNCKVQFAYYLNGQDVGVMYLKLDEAGSSPIPLWHRLGITGASWKTVTVGLGKRYASFNLAFLKTSGKYNGQSAVDDIKFFDCVPPKPQASCAGGQFQCANKACIQKHMICDMTQDCGDSSDEKNCSLYRKINFETGLGDLHQGVNGIDDDFDWSTASTTRNVTFPGPLFDHTYETISGKYVYVDSTQHVYNSRAWLKIGVFSTTTGLDCRMRFYLFMYGDNVNTLNVGYRVYNEGPITKQLYTVSGEQGPYWQRVELALSVSQPFEVIIEAKAGNRDLGGLAIDDFSVTPGCGAPTSAVLPTPPATTPTTSATTMKITSNCSSSNQFTCRGDNSCVDLVRVCDFRADCPDRSDEANCGKLYTSVK